MLSGTSYDRRFLEVMTVPNLNVTEVNKDPHLESIWNVKRSWKGTKKWIAEDYISEKMMLIVE